jgi:hypothetical protein
MRILCKLVLCTALLFSANSIHPQETDAEEAGITAMAPIFGNGSGF